MRDYIVKYTSSQKGKQMKKALKTIFLPLIYILFITGCATNGTSTKIHQNKETISNDKIYVYIKEPENYTKNGKKITNLGLVAPLIGYFSNNLNNELNKIASQKNLSVEFVKAPTKKSLIEFNAKYFLMISFLGYSDAQDKNIGRYLAKIKTQSSMMWVNKYQYKIAWSLFDEETSEAWGYKKHYAKSLAPKIIDNLINDKIIN